MPNLSDVQEQTEIELCAALTSAWGVSKIHTAPKETETKLADFPLAFCILLDATPSDEGEGSICSESGRLQWAFLLQAKKPAGGSTTLASEKRSKAQALRTAIRAQTFTHAQDVRWEGEQYDPREDAEVEAVDGSYLIRVRYSTFVEWSDDPPEEP